GDHVYDFRRDNLAGLANLPVVRRIAGIDGGTAGADRGAELVGDRKDDLLELLGRTERAATGNHDPGRGQLRTIALRQTVLDKGRQLRILRRGNALDGGRTVLAGRLEGGGANGDHLLGVGRLHGLDGVTGIDR